jgi:hypothetical protein
MAVYTVKDTDGRSFNVSESVALRMNSGQPIEDTVVVTGRTQNDAEYSHKAKSVTFTITRASDR